MTTTRLEAGTFTTIVTSSLEGLCCQEQVIYLWLCQYANSKTKQCYPSLKTLVRVCHLSRKTITKYLRELENKGLVKIEKRKDGGMDYDNNLYTVFTSGGRGGDTLPRGGDTLGVGEDVPKGVGEDVPTNHTDSFNQTDITKGGGGDISEWWSLYPRKEAKQKAIQAWNKLSTKEVKERKKEIPPTPTGELVMFPAFWELYPRHIAKSVAERAWKKIKSEEMESILSALAKQKAAGVFSKEQKYIPHPATWLNAKRWEDEQEKDQEDLSYEKYKQDPSKFFDRYFKTHNSLCMEFDARLRKSSK